MASSRLLEPIGNSSLFSSHLLKRKEDTATNERSKKFDCSSHGIFVSVIWRSGGDGDGWEMYVLAQ